MITFICAAIFVLAYLAISQESLLKVSKTAIGLVLAVVLWLLVVISGENNITSSISESAIEIFDLVIFLLSAMTLVEILTHYGLFDFIYLKLLNLHLDDKKQFFIITLLSFIFSSFLNNITATIVFLQISGRFFSGKNLLKISAAIVVAINAGGVFSPIGDVTTTMLWLSNKFTSWEIFRYTFLPSLTVFLTSSVIIGRTITTNTTDFIEKTRYISKMDWLIVSMCITSFFLPLIMSLLGLPAYFGLLLGLGLVWLFIDFVKTRHPQSSSNLTISIEKLFQNSDIASIYFFIGILLAISALKHLGILTQLSNIIFTNNPSDLRVVVGNIIIGFLSSVLDNIPLTAAGIEIVKTTNPLLWSHLALNVGTGGSLLLIGSAPGIIASTIVKELNFQTYFKLATFPALIAFVFGTLVWVFQYLIISVL